MKKDFDCVQLKRRGAEMVWKKIKDMSIDEQLLFWKKGTDELRMLQKKSKAKVTRARLAETKPPCRKAS
ncbi:MAG: hypothetical protein PHW04_05915 [Candidatus Wallbacteria bacterium]|nr:hypothetical protein [Candidatus Wallbacteria bacterium]